jgi:hypothetical protein
MDRNTSLDCSLTAWWRRGSLSYRSIRSAISNAKGVGKARSDATSESRSRHENASGDRKHRRREIAVVAYTQSNYLDVPICFIMSSRQKSFFEQDHSSKVSKNSSPRTRQPRLIDHSRNRDGKVIAASTRNPRPMRRPADPPHRQSLPSSLRPRQSPS